MDEVSVPAEREAAQRERRDQRVVEREHDRQQDRQVQERNQRDEERAQRPRAAAGQRHVHYSASSFCGWRKRENTPPSTATTASRNNASTEPCRQSGNPVPKRSTIWFP